MKAKVSPARGQDDEITNVQTMVFDGLKGPRELGFIPGGEERFLLFCGRERAAAARNARLSLFQTVIIVALIALVAWGGWWQSQREPFVLVRDSLGNIVQAEPKSLLYAGSARSDEEVKAFVREWVVDCFTWTPLDVKDRMESCLNLVDGKAKGAAKAGMRLAERRELVEQGVSGGVARDGKRALQTVIARRTPLELMVSMQRYLVDRAGETTDSGPLFVRAMVREVPRSASNGHGLMIVSVQVSENL